MFTALFYIGIVFYFLGFLNCKHLWREYYNLIDAQMINYKQPIYPDPIYLNTSMVFFYTC